MVCSIGFLDWIINRLTGKCRFWTFRPYSLPVEFPRLSITLWQKLRSNSPGRDHDPFFRTIISANFLRAKLLWRHVLYETVIDADDQLRTATKSHGPLYHGLQTPSVGREKNCIYLLLFTILGRFSKQCTFLRRHGLRHTFKSLTTALWSFLSRLSGNHVQAKHNLLQRQEL